MIAAAQEFSWTDDTKLHVHAVAWPVAQPLAVVGIIHGLGEHSGRYHHLAKFFQERQFACVAYDRRGHGRSGGPRGYAPQYQLYVDAIGRLVVECRRRYPNTPVFLYGHSMGGQLLLRYLTTRHPRLAGAVVSAPHIRLPSAPNAFKVAAGKLLRRWKPELTLPNGLDAQLLSRDQDVIQRYKEDSLVHDRLSAQTGIDVLENAHELDRCTDTGTVPTLLMHGDADGITSALGSEAFAKRNAAWVTYKNWPGYYHELHNEPTWTEVADFTTEWMLARLPAPGK